MGYFYNRRYYAPRIRNYVKSWFSHKKKVTKPGFSGFRSRKRYQGKRFRGRLTSRSNRKELKQYFTSNILADADRMTSAGVQSNTGVWWGYGKGSLSVPSLTVTGAQGVTGTDVVGDSFFAKKLKINIHINCDSTVLAGSDFYHKQVRGCVYLIHDKEGNSSLTGTDATPDEWLQTPDEGPSSFRKRYSSGHFRVAKRHTFMMSRNATVGSTDLMRKYITFNYDINQRVKKNPDANNWEDGYYLLFYLQGLPVGTNKTAIHYETKLTFTG